MTQPERSHSQAYYVLQFDHETPPDGWGAARAYLVGPVYATSREEAAIRWAERTGQLSPQVLGPVERIDLTVEIREG